VQTTLLGIAIALILALIAALVGPHFVDWNEYRPQFEAEASRLVGAPVRVGGAIDVRLLPTPTLLMNGVEIGPRSEDALRVRALGIEFALGALVRGQLRASQTRISGPQLTVALGADGRATLPSGGLGFDGATLAIDHLHVEDARLTLAHAASQSRIMLDKLWFDGEVRSLTGSFRGEGAFIADKQLYGYRINATRLDNGAIRLRFNLDPSERALAAEGDGVVTLEGNAPKFDGGVTFIRPAGTVLANGRAVVNEPWRLTSRVKAGAASALFEQIEFQYGPEERALKIGGTAELKFSARSRLDGVLSATQLDIDRLIAATAQGQGLGQVQGQVKRTPLAAIRTFVDSFGGALAAPLPMKIAFSADSVTLGSAPLQNLRGDLVSDGGDVAFESASLRAPGFTDVTFSGKAAFTPDGLTFTGPADVASTDPRLLLRWLEGRDDIPLEGAARAMRLRADVALGPDKIALERLKAEVDRKSADGRLVYLWPTDKRKARLDASLTAAELDIDGVIDFAQAAFGGAKLERPGEVSLALDIGRATLAGVEARKANAKLSFDSEGLTVERLSLGEFGGASLNVSGRISTGTAAPRGALGIDLDARDLSGLAAFLEKFAPPALAPARRLLERMGAAKLRATLEVVDAAEKGKSAARFALDGQSGGMRFALKSDATGDHANVFAAAARVDAMIEADEAAQMFRLLGLDRPATHAKGPGRLTLNAQGPLDGAIKLDGRVTAESLDARAQGNLQLAADTTSGQFDLAVNNADLSWLRGTAAASERLGAVLTSRVTMDGRQFRFENAMASVAGTQLRGKLDLDLAAAPRVTGELNADAIDGNAVLAGAAGMPAPRSDGAWPAEPFATGLFGGLAGKIALTAGEVKLASHSIRKLRTTLRLEPQEFSAEAIEGEVMEGTLSGDVTLRKAAEGLNLKAQLKLRNADARALLPLEGAPIGGRVGLQVDVEGSGLSPRALVGSLAGNGTLSLERATISGLDPRVFPTVMRAADRGLPLDAARIRDAVAPWLDTGPLEIAHADGVLTVAGGQVRLPTMIARARGADVSASGSLDLVSAVVDARIALAGPAVAPAGRPEIIVSLRGPLVAPRRNIDVAALAGWLALRAVDQQSKKLEAIEKGRGNAPEPSSIPETEIIPDTPPDPNVVLPRPRGKMPEPPQRPAAAIERPAPERAAPLPPPIDIAPSPGFRRTPAAPLPPVAPPPAAQPLPTPRT
jgi:uncharacterized protein involved in outer membrane biogenesis